jgi:hypothetical protein
MVSKEEIIKAYDFLRQNNHDISDETLDFIKDNSIKAYDENKDKKIFVTIKVDYNDADYNYSTFYIKPNKLEYFKKLINIIKKYSEDNPNIYMNWPTRDPNAISNMYNGLLTEDDIDYINGSLPYGDDNDPHTICEVKIIETLREEKIHISF